ncbi:MAG: hypothetical protein HY075_08165 [Deltaproteobacteria bacterium]|nr:hypothetical protein [Deltaproteobacteria bacterium]
MIRLLVAVLAAFQLSTALAAPAAPPHPSAGNGKVESILTLARKEFYRARYEAALKLLEGYLAHGKIGKTRPILHFYVITSIGHIYLHVKQDPDGAIAFFSKVQSDPRLKAAEQDIVSGWISGAREWKKLGKLPKDVTDADTLFSLGKQYFDAGVKKQKFTLDPAAAADFSIAAAYFVPFTVHFDKDERDGEALYMMGEIRRRTWSDNEYWSENFYLTEVIRRHPGTELAQKAYSALEDDVHFGYSGSGGDNTPQSWVALLKDLKTLAYGKKSGTEAQKGLN